MTSVKKSTKKRRREQIKLSRAVYTLASIIDTVATSIKGDLENGEICDMKQIKELTGACKELSALIGAEGAAENEKNGSDTVRVLFEGEGEGWAK